MKKFTPLMLAALTVLAACKKNSVTPDRIGGGSNVTKIAPDGFNFATSKNVSVSVSLKAPNGDALKGVVVSLYDPANTDKDAAIYKGVTDANGSLVAQLSVPATLKQVVIDPAYVGIMRYAKANINGTSVNAAIGGAAGFGGDIIPETIADRSGGSSTLTTLAFNSPDFFYPSPYTSTSDAVVNTSSTPLSLGIPKYLLPESDVISASLLSYVNASLPESKPLQTTHPDYLTSTATSTLNVTAKSDVWITFVAEGAGYLNTLAYYTYKTGSVPTSVADINATIAFPNASVVGAGGGLKPGNKIKLGTFEAGTSIGFILIADAWTGKGVNTGLTKYYSDAKFNPETKADKKKHTVLLYDDVNKVTMIGFEDLNREGSSDEDFNDLVFYASSNPITGISNQGVPVVDKGGDKDGDGVLDELDQFDEDPTRAFVSYYPSASGFANIAFEDNWPKKGDYDMNDVVVKYRYTFESNAKNQVVTIKGDYNVTAVGASFKNGFGVQFPFAASNVQSVTNSLAYKDNYITLAANGVEAGQSKAVIIPFDNTDMMLNNPDNAYFVNTLNAKDKITNGKTATVTMTLSTPVALSTITGSTINSFLISNSRRGYEIHLPGYAPTDKADTKLFGQDDDTTSPSTGKYYISKENWPWAMSFGDNFTYPLEQVKITDAYLHFADWASSGGSLFPDWYTNVGSGYRTTPNLYTK